MGRGCAIGLSLALMGCASIFPSSRTYEPVIVRVSDSAQFLKDKFACHAVADNYNPGLSPGSVAQSTAEGATSNAAYGVINPLIPAAGAAGGAATATISGLGFNGAATIKIYVRCLSEMSHEDHAFIIADPNQ